MRHATAIVHPAAQVDASVEIGPYCVIDEHVTIGPDCVLAPQVHVTGHTTIGRGNRFHAGAVIGDAPQDFKYDDEPTRLRIGDENTFREHVTVHRSNRLDEDTVIGSHNFFMAHAHVGHNSHVGNHVILANGALLGGHVEVQDRVFLSGNCIVHQHVRIGTGALMQGGSALSQDLPPFCISWAVNLLCGLNVIGLRRSGMKPEVRKELKQVYQLLLRSGENMGTALTRAEELYRSEASGEMIRFVRESKRGICRHGSRSHS